MATNPRYDPISVEEFLAIEFPGDRRYELVHGVIRMMTGGSPAHARVGANILIFLGSRLRGTGCRAYGSDMGLRIGDYDARYPDVSVHCGNPGSAEAEKERLFTRPVVVFEVLSPTTSKGDLNEKLAEYREVAALQTIVFVDPQREQSSSYQRVDDGWDELEFAPCDVALPSLNLMIPHTEIFARD